MTAPHDQQSEQDVRRAVTQLHHAMVDGRTDVLEGLTAPTYTLTHITGYRQPRQEWFGVIRSQAYDYHDIKELGVAVDLKPGAAVVTGQGIFTATINGTRRPWRLAFTMQYIQSNGRWVAINAHYTTW